MLALPDQSVCIHTSGHKLAYNNACMATLPHLCCFYRCHLSLLLSSGQLLVILQPALPCSSAGTTASCTLCVTTVNMGMCIHFITKCIYHNQLQLWPSMSNSHENSAGAFVFLKPCSRFVGTMYMTDCSSSQVDLALVHRTATSSGTD